MVVRMTVGLVLTVVALAIAGLRLWWLWRLAMSVQPAPERVAAVRHGRDERDIFVSIRDRIRVTLE